MRRPHTRTTAASALRWSRSRNSSERSADAPPAPCCRSSLRQVTAIDGVVRPGDERRLVGAEPDHQLRHLARLAEAAERVEPGEGVLVFLPMSVELYVALLAVFRLGMVALILDPSAGRDHIERCCALYPPQAWIASSGAHLLRLRSPALRRIPLKISVGFPIPGAVSWGHIDRIPAFPTVHPCDPATPALLTFTSGSTGQPKAAVRSHAFLLAQHRTLQQSLELTPGDVVMFVAYLDRLYDPIDSLTALAKTLQEHTMSLRRALNLIAQPGVEATGVPLVAGRGRVELRDGRGPGLVEVEVGDEERARQLRRTRPSRSPPASSARSGGPARCRSRPS